MKNSSLSNLVRILGCLLTGFALGSCSDSVEIPKEVGAFADKLPETVDYNLHVKPILSDRCFKCHGPDKNKIEAGLQLASFEGATQLLKSRTVAIDPGDIGGSELIRRILSHDPDEVMPTPKSNLTLTNEEKAILIKWVEQGAKYKEHWSLSPIEKPAVPTVGASFLARWGLADDSQTRWVRNDIDRFTLSKMNQLGLKPSPEADKTTLLRRVYMDLTGLPPAPAEVMQFCRDTRPDAYERVVDKLLTSPHFGEQQAISWLDLARFADSQGYQDDPMRNAYPYRDWVIRAFNQNKSFNEFVTEQLAGDLLPGPATPAVLRDRLVATSFNRQHAQSGENGIVPEEYRIEYVADRTNTFGKAMLGLTMECCRCHDHKYDPISAKDYYSLFAFFNQNKETGQITHNGEACPSVMLPTAEIEKKLRYIQTKIKAIEPKLNPENYHRSFANWATNPKPVLTLNQGLLVHLPFDADSNDTYTNTANPGFDAFVSGDKERKPLPTTGKVGKGLLLQGDCGIGIALSGVDRVNGKLQEPGKRFSKGLNFERNQPFSVSIWTNVKQAGVQGAIFRRSNYENEGYRGYSVSLNPDRTLRVLFSYVWPANCIELRTRQKLPINSWQHLTLTYNGNGKANGIRLFINGSQAPCELITDNLTKSLLHGPFGTNKSSQLPVFEIGNEQREKTIRQVAVDELRIYNRQLSDLEVQSLRFQGGPKSTGVVAGVLAISAQSLRRSRHSTLQQQLQEHYALTVDSTFANYTRQLTDWRGEEVNLLTDIPEVMTMQELPAPQRRKTFILKRGVFDAPGEEVTAQTPHKLGELPPDYPRNRLGLAKWLLNESNPLFARVMVNRFWQQYFGNGLVKTQEDFGNQGELPSHPELLDWLAVQFRQDGVNGWDVKVFIRRMVLSATYRQSSHATKEQLEADPDNKGLARGSSYRYTAEQVRDNVLAASGLLVREIGGPSVYPYQPAGIWEAMATRNTVTYRQQHGDSLYRRSMYTIWKRTSPPPMMLNFDAPDRALCTVRRQKTATPLQALVTLNDPQFVEAARVLAERTMKHTPSLSQRITYFFQAALSRPPRPTEQVLLQQLYDTERNGFLKSPKRAEALLQTGEYPRDQSLNPVDVAAYTVVATTVLNYDEALVKR
ncbi:DUF1553 domain-containing protein [Spirosoma endbachense]|uniref:DUF1553 domain-containing protein n=1 Tax=Spirosoma endbachense TaxID=2666025 RepID=A0A6P1W8K1_9BACT|nr:DUF1553 domain-containing protein [Spirosoma endbachense]QHW00350.1 DUF1553 domain-containing protein [Spirosoma endbachense]